MTMTMTMSGSARLGSAQSRGSTHIPLISGSAASNICSTSSLPQPCSLVETTVVDMRKSFQKKKKKAVLSIMDAGPKDETTAFFFLPNHNVVYIFYFSFFFFFFFFNESTAIYLLPYCCTVKGSCSEQTGGFLESS